MSGVIKDSINTPLESANVLARPVSDDLQLLFTITNANGKYQLKLKPNEAYDVTIGYLGFNPFEFRITLTADQEKNIVLTAAENLLDEVIVIENIPVVVKEDTISYNPKVFVTGTERKLKDVLEKLPGIEVDKNGGVKVMGKKVNTLLVDNKPFFGGNTKLGVLNIPADAVEGIDAIDNYNEVAFLKGLSGSEKLALNIKLKKNKKRFLFGDVEAGLGADTRYLAHQNIFYYSPKTTVNFIGDVNDVGVKSFTFSDYIDFEGGIGKMISDGNSRFNLSNNPLSKFLNNEDFVTGLNKFGAFNFSRAINAKWNFTGYGIVSNTKNDTRVETLKNYITDETSTLENIINTQNSNQSFILSKISLDCKPTSKEDISYSGVVKTNNTADIGNLISTTSTAQNTLNTTLENRATQIEQNLEWHKKFSKTHTISFAADYQYSQADPNSLWLTTLPILPRLIPLEDDTFFNIQQLKNTRFNNLELLFKHYWVLNKDHHIYTTIGNNLLKENYSSFDVQNLSTGVVNDFGAAGFNNDLEYRVNDFYLGVQHKFQVGIFTGKYGISAHNYDWTITQANSNSINKWVWLPDVSADFKFSGFGNVKFNYNLKSTIAAADRYANQFRLVNYNTVFRGNETLENELFHAARLSYTKFSMFRGLTIFSSITYNSAIEAVRNQTQIQGINQFNTAVLLQNPEERWLANAMVTKKYGKISLTLNTDVSFDDYQQIINNEVFKSKNRSQNYGVELSSSFKKLPNVELGLDTGYNTFTSETNTSKFITTSPRFSLDYDFLDGFIFEFTYNKTIYKDNNEQQNNYEIADTSLFYQFKESPWALKISSTNIFDANFKNRNSFSDFVISDQRIFILPRIWMFSVSYKL
ncbi:carboxypeptidase-like regulatory domain-containing protein [Cellulophaga sp. Hel_I_12]|uniref:carboxypeptidase-like regulatory domain-containing protein n=1 Tax=Cellulophaga sp. Hel_I_12 TaxID=1249972 RepID=UPI0018CE2FD3|nr:carboxypeptidase-like regulatory domain-containing protein [Cellulophaga sp. Hel_I_12]